MKRSKFHNDNRSVLNTDAFDKRRFKEIFEMSKGLQKIRAEGVLPAFEPLLADIWASLFKMKPEIKAVGVDSDLIINKLIMERIMADESFENYRSFTRLDDVSSAIGTMKFGESTNKWLADQKAQDEDLHKLMLEIHAMLEDLQQQEWQEGAGKGNQRLEETLTQAMAKLNEKLQQALRKNSQSFSQAMAQAMQETKQVKEGLRSLLGGSTAGRGDADLKKVPLRDQLAIAEKISTDKKMKEIADWAGRFKQIARKKQKSKHSESMERKGVTLGNDMERLLPMELALYMHPITKNDFLRRFVEGQTMQFKQKGPEVLEKGPIVFCLDQSGSMSKLDTQSKGFTLALMSIARKQRRDFCLIVFSTRTQIYQYKNGKMKASDMVRLARTFLGGGTNFALPLDEAMNIINESRFKQADVIFVTDGEDQVMDSFLKAFNKKRQEKSFNVLSLVIGCSTNTVEQFSDRVVHVKDFDDNGSFSAFEI
ncbi:VWA domain-containing protein [Sporosarcina sp. YIM B06819]|uniref:VWA domain-containing protein n=1 Tax=Sporosarcina sp. YIM B06819 TaxID=3081769 RepID=UPI00298C7022|nr:VWA domain-containing protein [Sporosarcina sp. YIM B06819]